MMGINDVSGDFRRLASFDGVLTSLMRAEPRLLFEDVQLVALGKLGQWFRFLFFFALDKQLHKRLATVWVCQTSKTQKSEVFFFLLLIFGYALMLLFKCT